MTLTRKIKRLGSGLYHSTHTIEGYDLKKIKQSCFTKQNYVGNFEKTYWSV
jgi:hypothetical protein